MSAEKKTDGYVITCPKCGTMQQRGYVTDATLICRKCHHEFYVFMEDGFQMEFPAYWTEDEALINRMKAFVVSIGLGHGMISYRPETDSFCLRDGPQPNGMTKADSEIIEIIKRITKKGNNAEVKRNSDMNKSSGGKNLYRSLGSIDIAAIARSVLMIARDETSPEIRYMFPVKSSLAYEGQAIRFCFNKEQGFRFLGPCEYCDETTMLVQEEGKSQKAERLLTSVLSGGSQPSRKVMELLIMNGVSERTVRTVAKRIGIRAFRNNGIWYWEMNNKQSEVN